MDYLSFKECLQQARLQVPRLARLLAPWVFMALHRNEAGQVSTNAIFDVVMRMVGTQQRRLSMCVYDAAGTGYLNNNALETMVADLMDSLPQLQSLEPAFFPVYAVYAARRFAFMLDPRRSGRVQITSLLASPVFAEFNQLQQPSLSASAQRANWFSVPFVTRVHSSYIRLDTDQNGMLSRSELLLLEDGFLSRQVRKGTVIAFANAQLSV